MKQKNMIDSAHTLESTGMTRKQAEALTRLLRDSIAEAIQPLATRAEVEVQLLAIRAELADLRAHVDAQLLETKVELADLRQNMATKAELAELRAQVLEIKAELLELKTAHEAQIANTNAQIALLRGELIEKIGTSMKYMAISVGFSTIAIITAIFLPRIGG